MLIIRLIHPLGGVIYASITHFLNCWHQDANVCFLTRTSSRSTGTGVLPYPASGTCENSNDRLSHNISSAKAISLPRICTAVM